MYRLRVEAVSSSVVEIDHELNVNFIFTNLSDRHFPGSDNFLIRMIWANIDSNNIKINRPFSIPALNVNETYPVEFKEKVRIEGTCIFYFFNNNEGEFYASDGEEIELYNEKSRFFVNSIFHAVRVQSKEEKYQFLSNYIAAGSLVMIVIIEIIKALFLGNS